MKKISAYIVLILFSAIYFVSSNDFLMKKIANYRYEVNSVWGADKYRYGDLYGFSYLPQFRIKTIKKVIEKPVQPVTKKIDFYCICDSYIWGFTSLDSLLYGVDKYQRTRWRFGDDLNVELDTLKTNFLLIEIAERLIRDNLNDTSYVFSKLRNKKNEQNDIYVSNENIVEKAERYLFNKQIDQNLEFNLFDYTFFTPVRELKARINDKLFGRIDSEVKLSADRQRLFYYPTIDPEANTSSFKKIEKEELNQIVNNLNAIYKHYSQMGFQYIYLSIIPSPVSVIEPEFSEYNKLLELIQNDKNLQIPCIDIYSLLKNDPSKYYYLSDTHWNYDGFKLFINEINKELEKVYNK